MPDHRGEDSEEVVVALEEVVEVAEDSVSRTRVSVKVADILFSSSVFWPTESARGGRGGRGGARGGRGGFKGAQPDAPKVDAADGWTNSDTANAWGVSNETPAAEGSGSTTTASTAEPSKPAPAKAPEPTGPPPISWKSIVAGTAKSKPAPTPTNAAGLEALENEINGTTVNDSVPTSATSEETPAVSASSIAVADNVQNTEEFNASGGWGDAPAQSETDAAAKAVGWDNAPAGTADVAAPAVAKKSSMIPKNTKMSWAQIARYVKFEKRCTRKSAYVCLLNRFLY